MQPSELANEGRWKAMGDSRLVAVTVVGEDRPGIVAGVTRALYEAGGNLEDATSTILRGHFAMMLIVAIPAGSDAPALETRLATATEELGVVVTCRPVDEAQTDIAPPSHMVAVYGADRPGIVYGIADALASRSINITDLTSRVIGSGDDVVYAVMIEVAAPDAAELQEALDSVRAELEIDVSVHPIDADVL